MEFSKNIKFNSNPKANDILEVNYNGYLSNSNELWIVYGFDSSWENTTEQKMEKSENGFNTSVKILDFDTFNFCFRNNEYHWDNNYNFNFISPILPAQNSIEEVASEPEIKKENSQSASSDTFDFDKLIEELLQPIISQNVSTAVAEPIEIVENNIDLGSEISAMLSEIDSSDNIYNVTAFDSLDSSIIEENYIELVDDELTNDEATIDFVDEITNDPEFTYEELFEFTDDAFDIDNISFEFTEDLESNTNEITENTNELVTDNIEKIVEDTNEPSKSTVEKISENTYEEKSLALLGDSKFIISPRQLSKLYVIKKQIKLAFLKLFVKFPKMLFDPEK